VVGNLGTRSSELGECSYGLSGYVPPDTAWEHADAHAM